MIKAVCILCHKRMFEADAHMTSMGESTVVVKAIQSLKDQEVYPQNLWE